MYIVSIFLSLILLAGSSAAQSGLEFDRDSVTKHIRSCFDGNDTTRVVVYNRSNESQTFDLLFVDGSGFTWFDTASVPLTNSLKIENIELAAHDSMWFDAKHYDNFAAVFPTTVVIRTELGDADTLFFNVTVETITLENATISHDFGHVEIGDSVAKEWTVKNASDIPFIVKSIDIDTFHWQLENIAVGDTIDGGDSRTIRIVYEPVSPQGRFSSIIRIRGNCGFIEAGVSVTVPSKGLHWLETDIGDTVTGCRRGGTYTVKFHNGGDHDVLLDSIAFEDSLKAHWSFVTPPQNNLVVAPGGEYECTVSRTKEGGNTWLYLYRSGDVRTRVSFNIVNDVALPVLKNSADTVIFNVEKGDQVWFNALIENRGRKHYSARSMERIGSQLWTITQPDTTWIFGSQTLMVPTNFAGTEVPGEYRVTYTIHDGICDDPLSQTLIVRVGSAGIAEASLTNSVEIFPTVASHELKIHAQEPFSYSVIDLLGRTLLSGSTIANSASVRVDDLLQGKYYVRIESNGHVETRSVVVRR